MAIELKQSVKQSQQLMMSPQVQQAIKILSLGRLELEEFIVEELRENPCLEEVEEGDPSPNELPEQVFSLNEQPVQDLSELRSLLKENAQVSSLSDSDSLQSETPSYDFAGNENEDLYEELARQVHMMDLVDEEYQAAMVLLEYIDEHGFMTGNLAEISSEHGIDEEILEEALGQVQKCEPYGIGARNVQECLLIQLSYKKRVPALTEVILKDHWTEFEKQDLSKLSKALKAPVDKVKEALVWIRENLDPKPARQFGGSPNQIIIPDVFLFKRGGEWIVSLNEDGLPRLKVSQRYASLLKETKKSGGDPKAKEFVNTRMKSASWIINAISERNKTILRVSEVILRKQIEFFEKGKEFLRPLTLKDIAEELNLHESTISRTTSNKYIHTPRGIYELKFFFNAGMSASGGQELANEVIRNWVAEYIKHEKQGEALSDQDLANLIEKEKNVKIARRTVAKYREALGILPSSKRNAKF